MSRLVLLSGVDSRVWTVELSMSIRMPIASICSARVVTLAEQMEAMGIRMDMLNSTVHTRLSTPESRTNRDMITHHQSNGHTPRSRQTIKLDTRNKERDSSQEREKGERVALEERILAAQRTLGPGASNRQIARVVNCSPTTVAKWLAQRENAQEEQDPA